MQVLFEEAGLAPGRRGRGGHDERSRSRGRVGGTHAGVRRKIPMTPQQVAEASAQALWANDRASRDLGMTLVDVGPGSAVLSMAITKRMTNGHGSAHGGYLFMLADSAFAFACNTYNQITVAQHCAITYIAPGRLETC